MTENLLLHKLYTVSVFITYFSFINDDYCSTYISFRQKRTMNNITRFLLVPPRASHGVLRRAKGLLGGTAHNCLAIIDGNS